MQGTCFNLHHFFFFSFFTKKKKKIWISIHTHAHQKKGRNEKFHLERERERERERIQIYSPIKFLLFLFIYRWRLVCYILTCKIYNSMNIYANFMLKLIMVLLMTHLVDYNDNNIRIRIGITKNIRCCNIILIIIHLFDDNTIIEPWMKAF